MGMVGEMILGIIIIDVAGSREEKGVRLYGKYDYYPIFPEKLVGSCGGVTRILLSKIGLVDHEKSLWVRYWLLWSGF
jgi:hypothetical protein